MDEIAFDSHFLTKLEYLSLAAKQIFAGQNPARHRAFPKSGGIEFFDYHDYRPGDDLRSLDWNILARLGTRLIKRFEAEEDLRVYFFLDCSASMNWGSPKKWDCARKILAALAYIALAEHDWVRVISYDAAFRDTFPLIQGKQHIFSLFRFLSSCDVGNRTTSLQETVRHFLQQKTRPGLAVLLSDFYDVQGFQAGCRLLRGQGYELSLIQIHDPSEAAPAWRGERELIDSETSASQKIVVTESVAARYREKFQNFLTSLERYCRQHGLGGAITRTDEPLEDFVLRLVRSSGTFSSKKFVDS